MELKNVSVVRDGEKLLDSVDLDIYAGENVAVIGPNGSGKTTLIKLLRGDIHPYYDEDDPAYMRIFGERIWSLNDIRSRMGIVSMDLQGLFGDDTLVSDVILSGFFSSLDIFRSHDVTDEMIFNARKSAEYMGVEHLTDRAFSGLSLGEMRRILISRAMVTSPETLVLDEPMTGLDIVMKSKFRKMFDIMTETGVSIIMITHDLTDIPQSLERIIMMKDGKVYADGPKSELLTSERVSGLFDEPINVQCDKGIYSMGLNEGSFTSVQSAGTRFRRIRTSAINAAVSKARPLDSTWATVCRAKKLNIHVLTAVSRTLKTLNSANIAGSRLIPRNLPNLRRPTISRAHHLTLVREAPMVRRTATLRCPSSVRTADWPWHLD